MADSEIIAVGHPAPNFELEALSGQNVRLADFKNRQSLVIYFFRHYLWLQCQHFARQLVEASAQFAEKQTRVLLIGRDKRDYAERMAGVIKADPGNVLLDPTGKVYEAFALEKVFFSLQQESAAFVIDRQGTLQYAYVVANQLHWYSPGIFKNLLDALDKLA